MAKTFYDEAEGVPEKTLTDLCDKIDEHLKMAMERIDQILPPDTTPGLKAEESPECLLPLLRHRLKNIEIKTRWLALSLNDIATQL